MAKRKAYPYDISYPLPHFKKGGYLDTYLKQMYGGGDVPPMTALNTSAAYMPKTSATMSGVENGAFPSEIKGDSNGMSLNPSGAFDSISSIYNQITNLQRPGDAPGSYANLGQTIGDAASSVTGIPMIGTAGKIVGGLAEAVSGQFTANDASQEAFKSYADNAKNAAAQNKQKDIASGVNKGNYFDQNQMMSAAYGGSLPVTQNSFEMQMGGPISKRYGMSRADLPQLSNYNSGIDIFEDGGEVNSNSKDKIIPTYPGTMPSGWTYSYLASPKYKERLTNQIRENNKKETESYRKGTSLENASEYLKDSDKKEVDRDVENAIQKSFSNLKRGRVLLKNKDSDTDGTNYFDGNTGNIYVDNSMNALPHELSHRNNMLKTSTKLGSQYIDIFDRYIPRDRLQESVKKKGAEFMSGEESPFMKALYLRDLSNQVYDMSSGTHDIDPDEVKADIYDLRYKLYNKGIHDARNQDFTKEHLDKAKEMFGDDPILKRLFNAYSDEDMMHLMNTVAQNKTQEQPLATAELGGELQPQQQQSTTSQITNYQNDMSHAESPIDGTPVDDHGNRVVTSNNRAVAKVQGGEMSYFSKSKGSSYIFSNNIYV